MTAQFPDQVWDGLTPSRERTDELQNPDTGDWAQLVDEIKATQQKVLEIEESAGGGASDAADVTYTADNPSDWDSAPSQVAATLDEIGYYKKTHDDAILELQAALEAVDVTLANDVATEILSIPVAQGECRVGQVMVGVHVRDGTDLQAVSAVIKYSVANKGGTLFAQVDLDEGTPSLTDAESTLALVASTAESPADTLSLRLKATSSLTPTAMQATIRNYDLGTLGAGPS